MGIRTVMIVEDHFATQTALSRFFGLLDWEVHQAASVDGAMAMLDTGAEPSLLILDLMLPDGDGEAILERVRRSSPRCFAVVASAVADKKRLEAVLWLGPDRVLPKPYSISDLCTTCGLTYPGAESPGLNAWNTPATWAD